MIPSPDFDMNIYCVEATYAVVKKSVANLIPHFGFHNAIFNMPTKNAKNNVLII